MGKGAREGKDKGEEVRGGKQHQICLNKNLGGGPRY